MSIGWVELLDALGKRHLAYSIGLGGLLTILAHNWVGEVEESRKDFEVHKEATTHRVSVLESRVDSLEQRVGRNERAIDKGSMNSWSGNPQGVK